MIVKNTLEEYRENIRKLIFLEKELSFWDKEISEIAAVQLNEKAGATNKINNVIEKNYIRKEGKIEDIALEKAYVNHYIELADLFISIAESEEDKTILKMRFRDGDKKPSYGIIAKKVNLSESGVRQRLAKAINKIEKTIDLNRMNYERVGRE